MRQQITTYAAPEFVLILSAALVQLLFMLARAWHCSRVKSRRMADEKLTTQPGLEWDKLISAGMAFGNSYQQAHASRASSTRTARTAPAGFVVCEYCGGNATAGARSCVSCAAPLSGAPGAAPPQAAPRPSSGAAGDLVIGDLNISPSVLAVGALAFLMMKR